MTVNLRPRCVALIKKQLADLRHVIEAAPAEWPPDFSVNLTLQSLKRGEGELMDELIQALELENTRLRAKRDKLARGIRRLAESAQAQALSQSRLQYDCLLEDEVKCGASSSCHKCVIKYALREEVNHAAKNR